jgi:hypothetical protein
MVYKHDERLMPHVNGVDASIRRLAKSAVTAAMGSPAGFSAPAKTRGTLRGTFGGAQGCHGAICGESPFAGVENSLRNSRDHTKKPATIRPALTQGRCATRLRYAPTPGSYCVWQPGPNRLPHRAGAAQSGKPCISASGLSGHLRNTSLRRAPETGTSRSR